MRTLYHPVCIGACWLMPSKIIFGTVIPDTSGRQMTIHVPTSPNICFCTTWGKQNKWNMHWNEQQTSINWRLNCVKVWSREVCCAGETKNNNRRRLGMSMNSRSNSLKSRSGGEHYRHCYQRMEKVSALLPVLVKRVGLRCRAGLVDWLSKV